jgi:hypothetical protein
LVSQDGNAETNQLCCCSYLNITGSGSFYSSENELLYLTKLKTGGVLKPGSDRQIRPELELQPASRSRASREASGPRRPGLAAEIVLTGENLDAPIKDGTRQETCKGQKDD